MNSNITKFGSPIDGPKLWHQLDSLEPQDMPAGDMRALPVWADDRAIAEEVKLVHQTFAGTFWMVTVPRQ